MINKELKKLGLNNIQYSVFIGSIKAEKVDEIKKMVLNNFQEGDKVCILEIEKRMLSKIRYHDNFQRVEYVLNKKLGEVF